MDNKDIRIGIGKMCLIKAFCDMVLFSIVNNFGHGKVLTRTKHLRCGISFQMKM